MATTTELVEWMIECHCGAAEPWDCACEPTYREVEVELDEAEIAKRLADFAEAVAALPPYDPNELPF